MVKGHKRRAIAGLTAFAASAIVAGGAVWACADDSCSAEWRLASPSFACGNQAMLNPGNDTRVNMLLLMRSLMPPRGGEAQATPANDDRQFGRTFMSWTGLRDAYWPQPTDTPSATPQAEGDAPRVCADQDPAVDAEIIALALQLFRELGLHDLVLHLNSVGCPACRPVYRRKLLEFFADKRAGLCEDCQSRLDRNPLRVLDCKEDGARMLSAGVPLITDYLCAECESHFEKVQAYLSAALIITRKPPLKSCTRPWGRRARFAAAAATTGSAKSWAARLRRASALPSAWNGSCLP